MIGVFYHWLRYSSFFLLGLMFSVCMALTPSLSLAQSSPAVTPESAEELIEQGQSFYEQGQWQEAIASWSTATDLYEDQGNTTGVTGSLLNQAKAMEMGGHYRQACETVLNAISLAHQTCEIQNGELMDEAIASITAEPDPSMQVLVWTSLGNVLRLNGYLDEAERSLQSGVKIAQDFDQPSIIVTTLLTLGKIQQLQYQQSFFTYQQTQKQDDKELALTLAQQALATYQQAEQQLSNPAIDPLLEFQSTAQILDLLTHLQSTVVTNPPVGWVEERNPTAPTPAPIPELLGYAGAFLECQGLYPTYAVQTYARLQAIRDFPWAEISASRSLIDSELSVAQSLIALWAMPNVNKMLGIVPKMDIVPLLEQVETQAIALNLPTAQSQALGTLGHLYEMWEQSTQSAADWQTAKQMTKAALALAQSTQSAHLTYQWQWQLGRLYRGEKDRIGESNTGEGTEKAIAYYQTAVDTLDKVRQDLLALNPDVRFALRDSVEPLYREFVSLLLDHPDHSSPTQVNLRQAIQEIDALQLAQLEDFLSCSLTQQVALDEQNTDPTTAILYPIILPDHLAVVVQLPQSDTLTFYQTPLPGIDIPQTLDTLRQQIERPFLTQTFFNQAQQVYDWLIRPIEATLEDNAIDTLVFVSDGALRNVPMSVLHDGEQFLVEKYAVALSPSLRLPASQALTDTDLNALAFGLSETRADFLPHAGFAPLENVATELNIIQDQLPSENRLNQSFTGSILKNTVPDNASPVVHLATHGQFSSNPEDTFLLAWDRRITLDDLSQSLNRRADQAAIELLVLSACKTAAGDSRATLGLAGVAIQSGARSTIASLWNVDDIATAEMMGYLYQALADSERSLSRAQALRQAQLALLKNPNFRAPIYWSAFVLVGNWQ